MKKIILLAAFGVAGFVSANNKNNSIVNDVALLNSKEISAEDDEFLMECISVGMYVWCTDEMVSDTMCWGEGAGKGCETYEKARLNQIRNSQLLTEFICGGEKEAGIYPN